MDGVEATQTTITASINTGKGKALVLPHDTVVSTPTTTLDKDKSIALSLPDDTAITLSSPTALETGKSKALTITPTASPNPGSVDNFLLDNSTTGTHDLSVSSPGNDEAALQLATEETAAKNKKRKGTATDVEGEDWRKKAYKTEMGEKIMVGDAELAELFGEEDAAAYQSIFGSKS